MIQRILKSNPRRVDDTDFFKIAKALADATRFDILSFIGLRGRPSCKEIVDETTVAQPTVSHHVKILSDAGLINMEREGQLTYVSVCWDVLENYSSEIQRRVRGKPMAARSAKLAARS